MTVNSSAQHRTIPCSNELVKSKQRLHARRVVEVPRTILCSNELVMSKQRLHAQRVAEVPRIHQAAMETVTKPKSPTTAISTRTG